LIGLAKIGLSLAIVAYLVWDATKTKGDVNVFANLVEQSKNWGLLAAAWLALTAATLLTFVRWCFLARALGVPCRISSVIRIGFWGLLFNLAPLGVVGGDLVKAAMLAREQPGQRANVVASVLVDRVIGLYILFVFATAAILLTGFWRASVGNIRLICDAVCMFSAVGALGISLVLLPFAVADRGIQALARIPRIGPMIESLLRAVRMYRHRLLVLVVCSLISVCVHALSATGCYLIARGLPGDVLPLSDHFVIIDQRLRPRLVGHGLLPDCARTAWRGASLERPFRDHSVEHFQRSSAIAAGTFRIRHRVLLHARAPDQLDRKRSGPGCRIGLSIDQHLDCGDGGGLSPW
jgi:hypothetical protein